MLQGGEFELDCSKVLRCLSYFFEPLLLLSPFCKNTLKVTLRGVTNAPSEVSVDAIRATWLPIFNKFVLNDESLSIKVLLIFIILNVAIFIKIFRLMQEAFFLKVVEVLFLKVQS